MLTQDTTRDEYATQLFDSWKESGYRNGAIEDHYNKVTAMTEAEFAAHRAKLIARRNDPGRAATIAAMAKEACAKAR